MYTLCTLLGFGVEYVYTFTCVPVALSIVGLPMITVNLGQDNGVQWEQDIIAIQRVLVAMRREATYHPTYKFKHE